MASYKEIVTKAVLGKGRKTFYTEYEIKPEIEPTAVLGCWIINHTFQGRREGNKIILTGSFDTNIWYSCEGDTKTEVIRQNNTYTEIVTVHKNSTTEGEEEIIVRSLKNPTVTKADVKDGTITYTVEKELGIEIVGDTKVKISIEDGEDPWEEIGPDINTEIDQSVNEDYLNEKKSD